MTGADLAEWEAFERAFGPILVHERLDAAQAVLSAVTAKSHGAKNVEPADFMPRWRAERPVDQSPEQLVDVLRTWASSSKRKGRDGN